MPKCRIFCASNLLGLLWSIRNFIKTKKGINRNSTDKKVYVAGDTENIPEMKNLDNIGIAFLPMNLPYTMSPERVADAVNLFHPEILFPYHYGNTDPQIIVDLLKNHDESEVRIRKLN